MVDLLLTEKVLLGLCNNLIVSTAICSPMCQHGGRCTALGICNCTTGWNGSHCELGRSI